MLTLDADFDISLEFAQRSDMDKETSEEQHNAIHDRVREQFGSVAAAYTTSVGHSDAAMLKRVIDMAQPRSGHRVLDIATGAGHTALTLAPYVAEVVAYDITPEMLEETARNAAARDLSNVTTRQGTAERLPFPDCSFDIVTVRQAPHHFADIRAAVREMARVVKAKGRILVIDTRAPESPELDRQFNFIEKLRDPSHVRAWRPSEWRSMIEDAGLHILEEHLDFYTENGKPMDFDGWTARMKTPPPAVEELKEIFHSASAALVEALRITIEDNKIFFCVPQIWIVASRA
jgi:ubiquinone/menaquinone biosynthesis C-methylase UbiE